MGTCCTSPTALAVWVWFGQRDMKTPLTWALLKCKGQRKPREGAHFTLDPLQSAPCLGDTKKVADITTVPQHPNVLSAVRSLARQAAVTSHPAGQKSLNIGLSKVFVQPVTQDPTRVPCTGGTIGDVGGRAGHSVGPPGPKFGLGASILGQWGCLRWNEVWKE